MNKFFSRLSQALQLDKSAPPQNGLGVGALIGQQYQLTEEIGRGGMGIVYRARDLSNDCDVAVKVINFETANALTLAQFSKEVEITARLHHPHIVTVYETGTVDTGAHGSSPYIAMELVQGKRLDEVRNFTYAKIIDLGRQICEALQYIHDQGFAYRDLKPANVILEKRGFHYFVKLLDFGLARLRGEEYLPTESSLAGSPFYLAPELISGLPADVSSDLYALGVTLYEMLTGRVPFSNFDEQNVLTQHLEQAVSPPGYSRSDMPPVLESIVLRLLEKSPKDRFASAQEVNLALEQAASTLDLSNRGNLPHSAFNVTEHKDEIGQIICLLESNQLVTLLQNGKDTSSIALAAAAQLTGQFAEGVWLINIESVSEPSMLLPVVAETLGVRENPIRPPAVTLLEHLREKNILLVFDHCELFPGACAQLIETILHACSDIWILVVSPNPLNIRSEKTYSR